MADQPTIQRLMLWDEDRPTMGDLIALSARQLQVLSAFIDLHGFEADFAQTLELAAGLGVSHERTIDLVRYLQFLDDQRSRLKFKPGDMLQEFRTYGRRKKIERLEAKLQAIETPLLDLFKDRAEGRLRAKKAAVTKGIVASAIGFDSLCDLRPVFNEERDKIVDYVPVAIVRIRAQRDISREPVELVFQIDKSTLEDMERFMELLRKKFRIIEQVRKDLSEERK
jgi:hypothetical protein